MTAHPKTAVIDDSEDYLQFIKISLQRIAAGTDVLCFINPDDARSGLKGVEVSLILCDINFDPENEVDSQGLELLQWLKDNLPHVPVVMMTRYLDQGFRDEAMRLGAEGFLEKPILLGQLRDLSIKYLEPKG